MSELSKVWLVVCFDSDSFWGLGGPQNHESTEQTAGATPHFQSAQGGQAIKPAGARAEPPQPTETLSGGVVFVGGQPPSRLETVWCLRMPFRLPYWNVFRLGDWYAVKAKSVVSEDEELSGEDQVEEEGRKKKPKKEKVGFRDRKVRKVCFLS